MTAARIRNLWGEEQPAELIDGLTAPILAGVRVPGLGDLLVVNLDDGGHRCALVQAHAVLAREHVEIDGRIEVELLPNSSGEDRIVVVIEP